MSDEASLSNIAAWCKAKAREGAETVHARAAGLDARKPKLTDAESAAIARKRIDEGGLDAPSNAPHQR